MTCPICNGKQLLPFKRKDGSIVPFAFLDCSCKVDEPEQYHELRPDDFDYPMSSDFREYTFERYGRPGEQRHPYITQEEPAPLQEQQPWDERQQYQLDQTRSQLIHMQHQLQELTARKPVPAQQPKKSEYKGLVIKND